MVIDGGVCLLEVQIAGIVAVEIGFDVQLVVAEQFVLTDDAEKETGSGRSGAELAFFSRVRFHGY